MAAALGAMLPTLLPLGMQMLQQAFKDDPTIVLGKGKNARKKQKAALAKAMAAMTVGAQPKPKKPARSRGGSRGGVNSLPKAHPYLATILDPDNIRGIKIPDEVIAPSATYTLTEDFVILADAGGNATVLIVPEAIQDSSGNTTATAMCIINDQSTAGLALTTSGFGSAAAPLVGAGVATSATVPGGLNLPNQAIQANISTFRVVSGIIKGYANSSANNTSGTVTELNCPFNALTVASDPNIGGGGTINATQQQPFTHIHPAADGFEARYWPTSINELQTRPVKGTAAPATITTIAANGGISAVASQVFGWQINGLPASTSIQCRLALNLEYTPSVAGAEFNSPTPAAAFDPNAMAAVQQFWQTYPSAPFYNGPQLTPVLRALQGQTLGKFSVQTRKNDGGMGYVPSGMSVR